jgi:hypothetical protein
VVVLLLKKEKFEGPFWDRFGRFVVVTRFGRPGLDDLAPGVFFFLEVSRQLAQQRERERERRMVSCGAHWKDGIPKGREEKSEINGGSSS